MFLMVQDPHSFANTHEISINHLDLDIRLNFETNQMNASVEFQLKVASEDIKQLVLDTRDLTIESVSDQTQQPLKFHLGDEKPFMGRPLIIELGDRTVDKVRIEYKTSPNAAAVQWLSAEQTASKKPFLFTQSQAILARTWIPCMDSPGAKVTYNAVVHVPKGFSAVMSARHGQHNRDEGVFRFVMEQPIPTYLVALAVGELEFKAISDRTGVYAEPSVVEAAASEFRDAESMLKASESLLGEYAWERWDILVLPPSFPYGGMENPRITFATPTVIAGDRSLVSLLAHELAHSWSGNLVTNATWDDFWLNEGFTTYIEQRIMEALYGKDMASMIRFLGQADLKRVAATLAPEDTRLKLNLKDRDPDDGMTDIAYEKGANFLRLIELTFGREAFDVYLRGYFERFKFKTLTTESFLEDIEVHLVKDQKEKWQTIDAKRWIYQAGIPASMVVAVSEKFNKRQADVKAFVNDATMPESKDWVTQEWLQFLNSLPHDLSTERAGQLQQHFALDQAGNAEVAFAWFMVAIRSHHSSSFDDLATFLKKFGRRKFLKPLYELMLTQPQTRELAKETYLQARAGYHSISQGTIDGLFQAANVSLD